jgi:hypothetical protein
MGEASSAAAFEKRWQDHMRLQGAQVHQVHDECAWAPPRPAAALDQATLALAQTLSRAEQDLARLAERLQPVLRDVPVAPHGPDPLTLEADCSLHRTLNDHIRQALELCAGLDALCQRVAL